MKPLARPVFYILIERDRHKIDAYKILVGKPRRKGSRRRRRVEDTIKIDLKAAGWIQLSPETTPLWAAVNTKMNHQNEQKARNFMTS
jgi:hypothetical protein